MKKRNGFVSNSSSSSFIIGIAKVTDKLKLLSSIKESNLPFKTYKGLDIVNVFDGGYELNQSDDSVFLETFTGTTVEINKSEISPSDDVFILKYEGNEGDSSFSTDYGWEMDYDIDRDFFYEDELKMIDFFKEEHGINNISVKIGAGRNG